MPDPHQLRLTKATLQRIASEQVDLTLADANLDALLPIVNGLRAFAAQVVEQPRDGVDPFRTYALEDWTDA